MFIAQPYDEVNKGTVHPKKENSAITHWWKLLELHSRTVLQQDEHIKNKSTASSEV